MRARERRRQLLEVAAELFAERGFRGTTTKELARAAGVTEPILYRHFQNKLDLFVTLIEGVGKVVIHAWHEALDGVEDPHERMRILLAASPATHERGRGIYRVIFQAMMESESDPEIARPLRQHLQKLHAFIRQELSSLQDRGVVRNDEPAGALAWLLMDVAVGYGIISPLGLPGQAVSGKSRMQHLLEELLATN
ncbi:MAG: TetR/AcrR family transcriptional regulator [Planctomycetota bacterium]|jgi:AcrR family transcriptional regulator